MGGATYNNSGNPFGFGGVMNFSGAGDYATSPTSTDFDLTGNAVMDVRFRLSSVPGSNIVYRPLCSLVGVYLGNSLA